MRRLTAVSAPLVVWYLVFPPQMHNDRMIFVGPDTSAPISSWQAMADKGGALSVFDTVQACEKVRAQMISETKDDLSNAPPGVAELPSETGTVKWTLALGALNSKCVPGIDRRPTASK